MLSFTHTLISLPFAVFMDSPWLIFISSLLWHVFADTLLHWNIYAWKFKRFPVLPIALDIGGGLVVAYLLVGPAMFSWPYLAAIIGGNIADVVHTLWELTPRLRAGPVLSFMRPVFTWHANLQLETNHAIQGLLWQATLVAISMTILVTSYSSI